MKLLMKLFSKKTTLMVKLSYAKQGLIKKKIELKNCQPRYAGQIKKHLSNPKKSNINLLPLITLSNQSV
jgi:hypothetical protein